jgi:hypothetical protein
MARPLNVKLGIGVTTIGAVLAGISVYLYAYDAWRRVDATRKVAAFHLIVLCLWIIVPPVWFAFETYLAGPHHDLNKLRKSQEVFSRIWVGVSAMLGVLASAAKKL